MTGLFYSDGCILFGPVYILLWWPVASLRWCCSTDKWETINKGPKKWLQLCHSLRPAGQNGRGTRGRNKKKKKNQKCFSAAKKEGTRWAGRLVQLSMMQCCCNSRVGKSIGRSQWHWWLISGLGCCAIRLLVNRRGGIWWWWWRLPSHKAKICAFSV